MHFKRDVPGLQHVKLPKGTWDRKIDKNEKVELIDDTDCFKIHFEQTEKYSHEWPYVATGDRIRKLLPNMNERLEENLIFCGNRTDITGDPITGTFQKLGRYTSTLYHFQIFTK